MLAAIVTVYCLMFKASFVCQETNLPTPAFLLIKLLVVTVLV